VFKYWITDRPGRRQGVVLQTGEEHWESIDEDSELLDSELSLTVFDWEKWWVANITNRGTLVVAEAYSPYTADPAKGRRVVYLDQNHWSTLARVMVDPDLVKKKSEIEPAQELIRLAGDGGVVIPLSAANMTETGALYGDRRYEIGIAMGSLSNGWMMRHPIAVRRIELTDFLAQEYNVPSPSLSCRPVFTLEPYAVFDNGLDAGGLSPTDIKLFKLAQTSPSVILDVLLDPERLEPRSPGEWIAVNQRITDVLRDSSLSKMQKEMYSYIYTWMDHADAIRESFALLGLNPSAIENLEAKEISRFLVSMRMTRIYSRIAMKRHTNPNARWKGNDLTDMVFLSCAAAYADFVAAEKHTAEDLRQAHHAFGVSNNVFPTIKLLVEALTDAGVQTETDRLGKSGTKSESAFD
jgi:hypothetical protein